MDAFSPVSTHPLISLVFKAGLLANSVGLDGEAGYDRKGEGLLGKVVDACGFHKAPENEVCWKAERMSPSSDTFGLAKRRPPSKASREERPETEPRVPEDDVRWRLRLLVRLRSLARVAARRLWACGRKQEYCIAWARYERKCSQCMQAPLLYSS
eukprot:1144052-Pelagomonas_calceolata.AAC.7